MITSTWLVALSAQNWVSILWYKDTCRWTLFIKSLFLPGNSCRECKEKQENGYRGNGRELDSVMKTIFICLPVCTWSQPCFINMTVLLSVISTIMVINSCVKLTYNIFSDNQLKLPLLFLRDWIQLCYNIIDTAYWIINTVYIVVIDFTPSQIHQ